MKTAILSVIYPGVDEYFPDFLRALESQTDSNFELYLVNDQHLDPQRLLRGFSGRTHLKEGKGTHTHLRKFGTKWVQEQGVDIIVFADADDYFSSNRISFSKELLTSHSVVFNEFILFGKESPRPQNFLKSYYKEGQVISSDDIFHFNCLGLSNTAIKTSFIPSGFENIPDDFVAFDWAFYALAFHQGAEAIFTGKIETWYRQYGNNIASPLDLSKDQILKSVKVKRDQYSFLAHNFKQYRDYAKSYEDLYERLHANEDLLVDYWKLVKRKSLLKQRWWEAVKLMDELK